MNNKNLKYSVIIITYNEEVNIKNTIDSVKDAFDEVEIIVADGFSCDNTLNIAKENGAKICSSKPGRGIQCNAGAKMATGNILLFLHGDTQVPDNSQSLLNKFFEDDKNKITTFRLGFDNPNLILKFYCLFTRFDSTFTKFGDQCITVRKEFFETINGFKNRALYEDMDFLKRARKNAKVNVLPASVKTSARRFEKVGIVKQQLKNAWYIFQYLLGTDTEILSEKYNSLRKNNIDKEREVKPGKKYYNIEIGKE